MGSMIWVTFSNPISTKSWILIYKMCFLKVLVYGLQTFMPFLVIPGISPRPTWFSHYVLLSKTTYCSPQWETILFNGLNCHFCVHMEVLKPSFFSSRSWPSNWDLSPSDKALPELAGPWALAEFWLHEFQLASYSEAPTSCMLCPS